MPRPTALADRRRRRLALAAAGGVLIGSLSACSGGAPGPAPGAGASGPADSGLASAGEPPASLPQARDVLAALTRTLDRRAAAVLAGDRDAWDSVLADDAGLRATQDAYFANLAALPVASLSYTLRPADLRREGDTYVVAVETHLRLDGLDATTAGSVQRMRFVPARHGAYRVAGVEAPEEGTAQPWDLGPVRVRARGPVLGVFDAGTAADAAALMRAVARQVPQVQSRVPYGWDGRVTVYALSDPAFLDGVASSGADPATLGGVAFPVLERPWDAGSPRAATRVVLSTRALAAGATARDRLLRHELAHVAIGAHDDDAPLWLAEGLAEWVSAAPLAPSRQALPAAALPAAERMVEAEDAALPADDGFGGDEGVDYALAWWACAELASGYGDDLPWRLLDALPAAADLDPDQDAEALAASELKALTGISASGLALRAARAIVARYGSAEGSGDQGAPSPDESPDESLDESPGESPSASPSG